MRSQDGAWERGFIGVSSLVGATLVAAQNDDTLPLYNLVYYIDFRPSMPG